MKTKCFLIMDRDGAVRLTRRTPYLTRGEIALHLTVTIPDACFAAPTIPVALDVPADQIRPAEARVEVEQGEAG